MNLNTMINTAMGTGTGKWVLVKEETSNGFWKEYTYDERGNLIKKENSSRDWRKYSYDKHGKLILEERPGDMSSRLDRSIGFGWTFYEYNERGNLIKEDSSSGYWRKYEYNEKKGGGFNKRSCFLWLLDSI